MCASTSVGAGLESKMKYVQLLRTRPIAIETDKANEQHYEVGTGVLKASLGPRMKYSCCLYPTGKEMLGTAEIEMLRLYVERAGLVDGMKILDLGYVVPLLLPTLLQPRDTAHSLQTNVPCSCGWGSLSLYLAEVLPNSEIVGFSNSATQKAYIDSVAQDQGLTNLRIVTGDVVTYTFRPSHYDRILSIELFEHMKNYELLMSKMAYALKPGGKLFVHIFTHKDSPYDFDGGWMTTHFFTGGTMPSADLLHFFQQDLSLEQQWWVNGRHYAKTCEDWLALTVRNRKELWPHLEETYGPENALRWFHRWQIFYMACAELFAWEGGDTWGVSHYLFVKPNRADRLVESGVVGTTAQAKAVQEVTGSGSTTPEKKGKKSWFGKSTSGDETASLRSGENA